MANKQYYELAAHSMRALEEAQDRCSERLDADPAPGERTQIKILMAELDANWQKVYQESLAVAQGTITITSPTKAQVERASEIADLLDTMTSEANTYASIVAATTEVMEIWATTDPQASDDA